MRTEVLQVYVTADEKRQIEEEAQARSRSVSNWLRTLAMSEVRAVQMADEFMDHMEINDG